VDKNIEIDVKDVVDNRNYKISSERAKNELNFVPKYEIEHAVREIIEANKENKFTDPLNNSLYYNIKKMKEIKLT
jgi:dTDP-D-glucose 4,6-dehydratase